LKIIQPEEDDDVSEFIELHILQRCHHPNIVGLLGTWKKGDEIFVREVFYREKSFCVQDSSDVTLCWV